MPCQAILPCKTLLTIFTLKRFFFCVNPQVIYQSMFGGEAFLTTFTYMFFAVCVRRCVNQPDMNHQATFLCEALLAIFTLIWLDPRSDQMHTFNVPFQDGSVSKTGIAILARIWFFLGMNTHVSAQVPFTCKASLTKTAMIGFFLFVYTTNVYCQTGVSCEAFLAIFTLMWCYYSVMFHWGWRHGIPTSPRSLHLVSPSSMSFKTVHTVEIYFTVKTCERIVLIHD